MSKRGFKVSVLNPDTQQVAYTAVLPFIPDMSNIPKRVKQDKEYFNFWVACMAADYWRKELENLTGTKTVEII